jgi:hypothetical protein
MELRRPAKRLLYQNASTLLLGEVVFSRTIYSRRHFSLNESFNDAMQRTAPRAVMTSSQHVYEVRPRKDKRGVDLISDALPFGGLWYGEPNAVINAIGYAKFRSRSHDAVIRVHDDARNVIETHEHAGEFKVDTTAKRASPARPGVLG